MKIFSWLREKWNTRPSEFRQASLAIVIGAAQVIYGVVKNGFDFNDLTDSEVQGAIVALSGQFAWIKTWLIAKKQRDPEVPIIAASDGSVVKALPSKG